MFKQLFIFIYRLARYPKVVWAELTDEQLAVESFNARVFYPLLGLITLTAFVGELANNTEFSVQIPLKMALISCISLFGGAHVASYLIEWFMQKVRGDAQRHTRSYVFVGYCYAPVILVNSFMQLVPDFIFLKLIWLIVPYCVWYGMNRFYEVNETHRMSFVVIISLIAMLTPQLIGVVLFFLMPGLRM